MSDTDDEIKRGNGDEEEIRPEIPPRPRPLEGTFLPKVVASNPNDPRYHPNVLRAAEEIKAILKKYDLAAMMDIHGPISSTFVRVINPSWSCAFFEEVGEAGVGVRFRSHHSNFPNREAQRKCMQETAGMLIGFHRQACRDAEAFAALVHMLKEHMDITHFDAPMEGDSDFKS